MYVCILNASKKHLQAILQYPDVKRGQFHINFQEFLSDKDLCLQQTEMHTILFSKHF